MILDRLAPILVASLCLAGCAASPSLAPDYIGRYPGYEPVSDATVPSGAPIASLPASAGSVLSIRNMSFSNGLRQVIVLEGPAAMTGENTIVVEALTPPMVGVASGNDLRLAPPSDTEIQSELAKLFPDRRDADLRRRRAWSSGLLRLCLGQERRAELPLCLGIPRATASPYPARGCVGHRRLPGFGQGETVPGGAPGRLAGRHASPHRDPAGRFRGASQGWRKRRIRAARTRSTPLSARWTGFRSSETPTLERRAGRHVRSTRSSPRQRRFARPRRDRELDAPIGRSSVPPVPLPGDLTTGAASPAATAPAARSATATAPRFDQDSMPLPK